MRDDVDPHCYWRADVWRRIVVIARGPVRQRARRGRDPDRLLLVRAPAVHGRPRRSTRSCTRARRSRRACGPATSSCAVNGHAIKNSQQVSDAIQRPGKITLVVRRAGALKTLAPDDPGEGQRRTALPGARVRDREGGQPALRARSAACARRAPTSGSRPRRPSPRSATSSRAAGATRSRARSASCSSRRRPMTRGRLPAPARPDLALARDLQPAAVPAARRRPHPVRADRVLPPEAARAGGLRARVADRHRRDADAVRAGLSNDVTHITNGPTIGP